MDDFTIKILAIDDEPFMLKLLASMLANLGYTSVSTCDSGRAALDKGVASALSINSMVRCVPSLRRVAAIPNGLRITGY